MSEQPNPATEGQDPATEGQSESTGPAETEVKTPAKETTAAPKKNWAQI